MSESACAPRRSGYEPEVLITSVKQKRMPKHPFQCSGNRTRTCDLRVMSPTSYQLLHPAICLLLYINQSNVEPVSAAADMSPWLSYQLLHPAIYLIKPDDPPRRIHPAICFLLFYLNQRFEPVSAAADMSPWLFYQLLHPAI